MCINTLEGCPSTDVTPHAVLPTLDLVPSLVKIPGQLAQQMRTWIAKNWMQYSVSHVTITALLLSQNGLRSNLRAPIF